MRQLWKVPQIIPLVGPRFVCEFEKNEPFGRRLIGSKYKTLYRSLSEKECKVILLIMGFKTN